MLTKFLILAVVVATASAQETDTCLAHVEEECLLPPNVPWNPESCNSVYGQFRGNEANLNTLLKYHLQDSFKFALMASQFGTDDVNRHGMQGMMSGYSDKMWGQSKKLMQYILKRGGSFANQLGTFQLNDVTVGQDVQGEVEAFAATLDMLKQQAGDAVNVYKQAMVRRHHTDVQGSDGSFDPSVAHFIEKEFIAEYTDDIHSVAGNLNVLAKMARKDKTKMMGLHLFDKSLM